MKRLALGCLLAAITPFASIADELRYEAVWHSGTGTNIVTPPQSRAEFIATGEAQTAQGRRLIDVETARVDGRRIYAGLWVGGSGTNLFFGPMGATDMRETIEEREEQGLRMVDFEVFRTPSGGRRYLSVWRPGTGEQVLTGPMQQDAFLARGQRLVEDEGLRLIDVEVERRQGVLLYHGLFRSGTGGNRITTPRRRAAFRALREEMRADGLELVDMERIRIGGRNRFVGVWSSGDGEGQISRPRNFEDFAEFGEAHTEAGFRTRDMELRVAAVNTPDPAPQPDPDGPDTGDFPEPPSWLTITNNGLPRVELRLGNQALNEEGYRLTLHQSLLPEDLPRDEDFNPVIPDAFCGLRIFSPDSSFWLRTGGEMVEDGMHLHVPSYSGELQSVALGGIDFTGPMGACEAAQGNWQFPHPLTTGTHAAPDQSLALIVEFPERVEFLNFNIQPDTPLSPHQYFNAEIFALLRDIAVNFKETGANNGYCDGVQDFIVALCANSPASCPIPDPHQGC